MKSGDAGSFQPGYKLGQMTGVVAGVLSCLLWMAAMWDPASPFSLKPASMLVVFLMILIAILAVIAAIKGNGAMLLVLFVVAFLPIGLYVIGVPHWIRWVGLTNLGYLIAGLLLRTGAGMANGQDLTRKD